MEAEVVYWLIVASVVVCCVLRVGWGSSNIFFFVRVMIVFSTGCVLFRSVSGSTFLFVSCSRYFRVFYPGVIIVFSTGPGWVLFYGLGASELLPSQCC